MKVSDSIKLPVRHIPEYDCIDAADGMTISLHVDPPYVAAIVTAINNYDKLADVLKAIAELDGSRMEEAPEMSRRALHELDNIQEAEANG